MWQNLDHDIPELFCDRREAREDGLVCRGRPWLDRPDAADAFLAGQDWRSLIRLRVPGTFTVPGPARTLTTRQAEAVKVAYAAGAKGAQLARAYGVSVRTIWRTLK